MPLEKGLLKSEVKVRAIRNGKWRQLAIEDGNSQSKYSNSSFPQRSFEEGNESREAASSKITNSKSSSVGDSKASNLANGDAKDQKCVNSPNPTLQSSILEYEDICRRENKMIKQALLADLAYVELELGNSKYSNSSFPQRSFEGLVNDKMSLGNSRMFQNIYFSDQYICSGVSLPTKPAKGSSRAFDTAFLKPEEARGTLYANLAALSAVKGDLEWAHCYSIQALSTVPNSAESALTAIYVDIMTGKSQKALTKLKQCSRVRFLPSSSTLKGFC
ncbi:tetratricopeptide repeat (TPR)-like superfamily protein [Actinidia rufa]|uniref:Tetratricopeptide repeat (TPR)-like superfamily protein n=1 Tax=Actinidia rufa TaxID=165716 RepID=A0A7J0E385_9ERIC|nr:tetratricopeptide repeat (TPR)-like superfamily protein [Actinidia rufa]